MFFLNLAPESPLFGESAIPTAANPVFLGVVVLLCVGELAAVIRLGLTCTERFGDCDHGRLIEKVSLLVGWRSLDLFLGLFLFMRGELVQGSRAHRSCLWRRGSLTAGLGRPRV